MLNSAAEQRPVNIGCFVLERDDSSGALRVLWHASSPPAAALAWRQTMELQGARDETPRRRGTLTLASVLPSALIAYSWPDPGPGTRGPSVGQLKSAVQKNVRLCRPAAAVRAACALLRADASEGLRRLAVIAAEDAALDSQHFPLLVWATAAAAKGFQPPPAVWALVLRAVHAMATLPLRDPAAHGAAGDGASLFAPPGPPAGERGGLLVRCCLLRAQLGGMKGDVAMLRGCASLWARRYADGGDWPDAVEAAFRALPPPEHCLAAAEEAAGPQARCAAEAELESVPPLRAADVPPTALDMHCSSLISDLMRDPRLGGVAAEALDATGMEAEAALRAMVWDYRSGLNNKTPKIEEPAEGCVPFRGTCVLMPDGSAGPCTRPGCCCSRWWTRTSGACTRAR